MFHVRTFWDPQYGEIKYSSWRNEPAAVVPKYQDKFQAYRPLQQRARDGTVTRHRTGGLKRVS